MGDRTVSAHIAHDLHGRQETLLLGVCPNLERAVQDAAIVKVQVILAPVRQDVFAVIGVMRHQLGQRQRRHDVRHRELSAVRLVQPSKQPQQLGLLRVCSAAPQTEAGQIVDFDQQWRNLVVYRQVGAHPNGSIAKIRARLDRPGKRRAAAKIHEQVRIERRAGIGPQLFRLRQRVIQPFFPTAHAGIHLRPCR
ncbi:hypothetical protein D3C71_1585030 [compost metagenome]